MHWRLTSDHEPSAMKNIIWFASYPKSGNTWLRIFFSNLIRGKAEPVCINELERTPIASARQIFDDAVGYEACDLSHEEIDRLRPEVYEYLSRKTDDIRFLKIHDAFTFVDNCPDKPLISYQATRGAVYIIRNPLDLVISLADHMSVPIDQAIEKLNNDDFCFGNRSDRVRSQLRQRLLSWQGHVRSWVDAPDMDIHVIRYEDMKQDSLNTFYRVVQFCGFSKTMDQVRQAIALSDFKVLQRQEKEKGFIEKPVRCKAFFRRGEVGGWQSVLTTAQTNAIIAKHGEVMARFGYLDKQGRPFF